MGRGKHSHGALPLHGGTGGVVGIKSVPVNPCLFLRALLLQSSFDVNELVGALGIPTPATDPFTQQAVKKMMPIRADVMTPEFFVANKWTE
jgi:hypothetical protein